MPLDRSIKKVLMIGSGPIVIGQAAEFDYAGAQACRVLKEAGADVVLVNSNPATIMTDRALADEIYLEPLTVETVKRIIKKERPDSLLAGLGGQTGLTLASELYKASRPSPPISPAPSRMPLPLPTASAIPSLSVPHSRSAARAAESHTAARR